MSKVKCLERFLNGNLDSVYRFAYTYMRSKDDAEEIVNESVVKALKGISGLKSEAAVKSWFYRIVANTAITELRRRGKCICVDPETLEAAGEDDYSELNFESMLRILGEAEKAVVVLKCCDDMTFSEISLVLGISESTAKTRFYSAVKKLRKEV